MNAVTPNNVNIPPFLYLPLSIIYTLYLFIFLQQFSSALIGREATTWRIVPAAEENCHAVVSKTPIQLFCRFWIVWQ